jgi:hypothetical protein
MSDDLKVSSDLESNEARHPEAGMKIGQSAPKIKTTAIPGPTNDFWSGWGTDAQAGNKSETASNTY